MTDRLPGSSWVSGAACVDQSTEWWFAPDRFGQSVAVAVCRSCPVRRDCLASALTEERELSALYRFGIRGGLTPNQRVAIRVRS